MVAILAKIAGVHNPTELAEKQFKEKSRQMLLITTYALVRGDFKVFEFKTKLRTYRVGIGTIETVDTAPLDTRAKRRQLEKELRATKVEKNLDYSFLALVNIQINHSVFVICGPNERVVAEQAYGGKCVTYPPDKANNDYGGADLDLGSRVSRKKQFVPPMSGLLKDTWVPPNLHPTFAGVEIVSKLSAAPAPAPAQGPSSYQIGLAAAATERKTPDTTHEWTLDELQTEDFGKVIVDCTEIGCQLKRVPTNTPPQKEHVH